MRIGVALVVLTACVAGITYLMGSTGFTARVRNTFSVNVRGRTCDELILKKINLTAVHNVSEIKVIYSATASYIDYNALTFDKCHFNNCIAQNVQNHDSCLKTASVVIFQSGEMRRLKVDLVTRQNQIWLLASHECWVWPHNRWETWQNGQFNGTMTYRHDSELFYPYGRAERYPGESPKNTDPLPNYAAGKTRGAFVYVSNCASHNYERLDLMKQLSNYIDVDVYGDCTGRKPCGRMDFECESKLHKQYRFYLSFENSLCSDYITEKFWSRLASDSFYVPVVVGGVNVSQYTSVAPPHSFIHAYDYQSLEDLGKHLQYLRSNDAAYNEYHRWRASYKIYKDEDGVISCKLCEMANKMPKLPAKDNLAEWWNNGPVGQLPYF